MKTNIICTLRIEGIHHWPDCNIERVSFLKHPHRHEFHITCKKEVSHSDRDIEFIDLKCQVKDFFFKTYWLANNSYYDFKSMSCEAIAEVLIEEFDLNYCKVMEDGENGAEVFL